MKKAAFLDRDGVLNQSELVNGVPIPPGSIEKVVILGGVVEAIRILRRYEFIPIVVTNQPDVARGLVSRFEVEAINRFIGKTLGIDHFYTCFHDDVDLCVCRKPSPGLIHLASKDLDIDVSKSFMVGDRWRDVSAGQAAGCKSFFVDHSYHEITPTLPFTRVKSLYEAVQIMVGEINGIQ
jgi:D-glycero-D-manno-heptose 1,7-bisphosphate phosphatase